MHSTSLIIFLCLPTLALNSPFLKNRFGQLIVFGDSLSDTGNVYKLTNREFPFTPPYYRGRYSNGPIWSDRLEVLFKKSFAYGGATTDNNLVQGAARLGTVPVPGIRQQVATYLNTTHKTIIDKIVPTLYILWGGGNDFSRNSSISPLQIASSLMNSVRDLLNAGVKNVLVFNQPPGNLSPFGRRLNQPVLLAALTAGINNAIAASLAALKPFYPDSSLHLFDVHGLLIEIISNASSIKFDNTIDQCWITINTTTLVQNCTNPNKYVYIDDIHFTAPVHQLIATFIQPFLSICYNDNATNPFFRVI